MLSIYPLFCLMRVFFCSHISFHHSIVWSLFKATSFNIPLNLSLPKALHSVSSNFYLNLSCYLDILANYSVQTFILSPSSQKSPLLYFETYELFGIMVFWSAFLKYFTSCKFSFATGQQLLHFLKHSTLK